MLESIWLLLQLKLKICPYLSTRGQRLINPLTEILKGSNSLENIFISYWPTKPVRNYQRQTLSTPRGLERYLRKKTQPINSSSGLTAHRWPDSGSLKLNIQLSRDSLFSFSCSHRHKKEMLQRLNSHKTLCFSPSDATRCKLMALRGFGFLAFLQCTQELERREDGLFSPVTSRRGGN